MIPNERRPPERVTEADADLLRFWHGLTDEQQRHFFADIRIANQANDNVIPFDQMLLNPEFHGEIAALASAANVSLVEFGLAVNPNQYPAYSTASDRCRIDRYLARTGSVDIRVQVYTRVEFHHRLIPATFELHVLEGEVMLEREGAILRYSDGAVLEVEGDSEITFRAQTGARFLYVNHPMTAWIRRNYVKRSA